MPLKEHLKSIQDISRECRAFLTVSKFIEAVGIAQVNNDCRDYNPWDCQEAIAKTGQKAPASSSKKIEPPDLMVIPGVFVKLVYHH